MTAPRRRMEARAGPCWSSSPRPLLSPSSLSTTNGAHAIGVKPYQLTGRLRTTPCAPRCFLSKSGSSAVVTRLFAGHSSYRPGSPWCYCPQSVNMYRTSSSHSKSSRQKECGSHLQITLCDVEGWKRARCPILHATSTHRGVPTSAQSSRYHANRSRGRVKFRMSYLPIRGSVHFRLHHRLQNTNIKSSPLPVSFPQVLPSHTVCHR